MRRKWPVTMLVALGLIPALLNGCGDGGADPPPSSPSPSEADAAPVIRVAAPRPTELLPPGTSCVSSECHATFADARHIHQPIAQQACDSCHGEDTGGHVFPLKRSANDTCTFCHTVSGVREHEHAPLAEGGCLSCHDPHASPTKFLLKAISVERLCAQCHEVGWDRYVHEPFANGQCTLCHDPHQSDNRGLLRGRGGREHCLSCHSDMGRTLAAADRVHTPAQQNCLDCHNPHTGPAVGHTVAVGQALCATCHEPAIEQFGTATFGHSALTEANACGNCHNPHAGATDAILRGREDRLCLTCHAQPMQMSDDRRLAGRDATLQSAFLHGPIRMGECSPCHAVHGAEHEALLHEAMPTSFYASFAVENYALCFQCHSEALVTRDRTTSLTGFRDGDRNLHFVHVNREQRGRTCRTCHAVHGSDLPNHIAATVPFEGSTWAMPIGYERVDDGGRCAPGCHEPKTYRRADDEHERGVP